MRIQKERREPQPATVARLLRLHGELDLLLNAGHLYHCPDVRRTVVLDICPHCIAVAQSSPPILKTKLGSIEASFVQYDPISAKHIRWGWSSRILGFNNEYASKETAPGNPREQVVFIAPPTEGALFSTNVRSDYRLTVSDQKIIIKSSPCAYGVRLLDFSAGGVQIAAPGLPQIRPGALMRLNIVFPWPDKHSRTHIKSLAEVVWMEYVNEQRNTRLGLSFRDMDMETRRSLNKIINHYMLAEQRSRNDESLTELTM